MSASPAPATAAAEPSSALASIGPSPAAQLLLAAALQATMATEIEAPGVKATDDQRMAHRSYVVAAILQAVAALESELWAVVARGPGHHLGNGLADDAARQLLSPLKDVIHAAGVLDRYQLVLQVLQKERLDPNRRTWQDVALAVRLRNEISRLWSEAYKDGDDLEFVKTVKSRNLPPPPFVQKGVAFFPDQCLSAACARWVVRSCARFIDAFSDRLGLVSPLAPHAARLDVTE